MSPESSAATAAAASLALSALLATHEPQIKLLAEKLGMNPILFEDSSEDSSSRCAAISQFLPSKSPRLFLLRHLLSNKLSVDEALPPARFALDWFQQHSELITKIRKYSSAAASSVNATIALGSTIQQFQVYGDHKSTLDGDPIVYVRIGLCNPKGLMDAITDFNQLLLSFTLQRIPALDVCDGLSLEKSTKIVSSSFIIHLTFVFVKIASSRQSPFLISKVFPYFEETIPDSQNLLVNPQN